MRKKLPPDNEDELKKKWTETFHSVDADHNGTLSKEEVRTALDDINLPTTQKQLDTLFNAMDLNNDGSIDIHEFIVFASRRHRALRHAFESLLNEGGNNEEEDEDDGTMHATNEAKLTAQHLRIASAKAGLPLSNRDIRDIMNRVDKSGNGHVDFKTFVEYSALIPHINPHAYFDKFLQETWKDSATPEFEIARDTRPVEGEDFVTAAIRKLVCGGAAGILSRTITAPLDRIRLLMMTSVAPVGISDAMIMATTHPPKVGYKGFWRGNGMNCIKIAPEMGIKLFSFDVLKKKVATDPDNVSAAERFVAGGAAGALAEVSVYPMEVMRTRMATGSYNGAIDCFTSIGRGGGGMSVFYAGVVPSVLGIIPFAAIDLAVNSLLQDAAAAYLVAKGEEVSVPLLLSCGMVSSATATVATFPLNVVRTVAQATARPTKDIIISLKKEGIHGFYRGIFPCLLKVMPATSISYASYEWLKKRW